MNKRKKVWLNDILSLEFNFIENTNRFFILMVLNK